MSQGFRTWKRRKRRAPELGSWRERGFTTASVREAANFGERHKVNEKRCNQQPGLARHQQQQSPAKEHADQQIDQNCQKEFHVAMLVILARGASRRKTG